MPELFPFRALRYRQLEPEMLVPKRDHPYHPELLVGQPPDTARAVLDRWLEEGVLQLDPQPGLYVLQHEFGFGEDAMVRTGILGLLSGEGLLGRQEVPRRALEPRLAYLRRTRLFAEPPVLLSRVPHARLEALLEDQLESPTCQVRDAEGVVHRLWRVERHEALVELFLQQPLLLLQGNSLVQAAELYGNARFPALILCADDPALLLMANHRGVRGVSEQALSGLLLSLEEDFEVIPWRQSLPELVREIGLRPGSLGMGRGSQHYLLRARHGEEPAAARLHRQILGERLGITAERILSERSLEYLPHAEHAAERLAAGELQLVFYLAPLTPSQLLEAAQTLPPRTVGLQPRPGCGLLFYQEGERGGTNEAG